MPVRLKHDLRIISVYSNILRLMKYSTERTINTLPSGSLLIGFSMATLIDREHINRLLTTLTTYREFVASSVTGGRLKRQLEEKQRKSRQFQKPISMEEKSLLIECRSL